MTESKVRTLTNTTRSMVISLRKQTKNTDKFREPAAGKTREHYHRGKQIKKNKGKKYQQIQRTSTAVNVRRIINLQDSLEDFNQSHHLEKTPESVTARSPGQRILRDWQVRGPRLFKAILKPGA